MAIRKRHKIANYIKINDKFEFIGVGFTSLNETFSPTISSKKYISDVSKSQSISGYEWSSDFEADQIENNTVVEYIMEIGELLKTGADTETEYLIVDLDKPADGGDNKFRARKFNIAVSVDSTSDEEGELGFSGSFKGIGDPVLGTVTIDNDTKEATFADGFTPKTV